MMTKRSRDLAYLAFIFLLIITIGAWWIIQTRVKGVNDSHTAAITAVDQQSAGGAAGSPAWMTYTDELYQFSIQYPCDSVCRSRGVSQMVTADNAEHRVILPTQDARAFITLAGFDGTGFEAGGHEQGLGDAARYSPSKMRTALQSNVGTRCDIYYTPPVNITDELCSVAMLGDEKVIQLFTPRRFGNSNYSYISYFVPRSRDLWLEVDESYENGGAAFVSLTSTDPYLEPQIAAITGVMGTLAFIQ